MLRRVSLLGGLCNFSVEQVLRVVWKLVAGGSGGDVGGLLRGPVVGTR